MSNSKNYNSIVFLTTLCLGLMFVSTTPQVLTFAALTKNFDIQSEVEVKDDLDNNPDNEEIENLTNDDFAELFAQLLIEIKSNVNSEKFFLPLETDFYVDAIFTESSNSSGGRFGSNIADQSINRGYVWTDNAGKHSSDIVDQSLNLLVQNAIDQKFKPKALEIADYCNENSKDVKIGIEATNTNLSLKVSFTKKNAKYFAEFLNQEFSLNSSLVESSLTKQIYESTKATSENNQVFIITRLPRGSLDALLANKDAQ